MTKKSGLKKKHTRPRILFFTFNVDYMNPTRQQIKKAIKNSCDVVLFGPGHASWEEIGAGPTAFVERHGPFDMVIGDENSLIPPPSTKEELPNRSFLNHACRFDRSLIWKGAEYYQFLKTYKGKRVISLMQSDFYNFPPEQIERIEETGDYYMLWGEEMILSKGEANHEMLVKNGMNEHIYHAWTDRYLDFLRRNSERIISTPMLVDMHEFCDRRLEQRSYDWSVLGANYDAREKARSSLDNAGIGRAGKLIPYLYFASGRIGINVYAHHWSLDLFSKIFRRTLQKSRFSFTCGSVTKYAVRKFFEIPASGCVLVSDGCQGFSNLGFEHKRNALLCDPDDILDVHEWLKSDLDRAQEIADCGRTLIEQLHSVPARGQQLAEAFQRIHDGRFNGSYWKDGCLEYN